MLVADLGLLVTQLLGWCFGGVCVLFDFVVLVTGVYNTFCFVWLLTTIAVPYCCLDV